jgi:elongation factor P
VRLDEKDYQFLFKEGDQFTFMDNENYEQITLTAEAIGDGAVFLKDGMMVTIQSHEGAALSVALPDTVTMEIVEADPVVKGQTASSSYKPAKLENGVRVMVPPHIAAGTRIVVNTADGSYVERAKD